MSQTALISVRICSRDSLLAASVSAAAASFRARFIRAVAAAARAAMALFVTSGHTVVYRPLVDGAAALLIRLYNPESILSKGPTQRTIHVRCGYMYTAFVDLPACLPACQLFPPSTWISLVLLITPTPVASYNIYLGLGLRSPRLQGALRPCRTRSGCAGLDPGCSAWSCTAHAPDCCPCESWLAPGLLRRGGCGRAARGALSPRVAPSTACRRVL